MEKVYYALGELAYLVASVDGVVQQEEINRLHAFVVAELKKNNNQFEYSDIIFKVLNAESLDSQFIYESAFKELREASNYVTDDVKTQIIDVLKSIADSFNGIDENEQNILKRISEDLAKI